MANVQIETEPEFRMADVGGKAVTARKTVARGTLAMNREAFDLLKAGRLPKGDALKLAEIAGLLAAKRTPDAIPLCHPIPLDKIGVSFELDTALPAVHAFCEASARARTGVEMEALSGVMGALLTVYDLVKPVDPALTISDVRLIVKEGGKSGMWVHPAGEDLTAPVSLLQTKGVGRNAVEGGDSRSKQAPHFSEKLGEAAVITVSDRCFAGEAKDLSGAALVEGLKAMGFTVGESTIVPDEKKDIVRAVRKVAREGFDLVVLTGGTGLSPRDVTPEAVESVCDRLIPGIGEAIRAEGLASTPMSSLSRSLAGQLGNTVVVALPGSIGGVQDGLGVLSRILPHAVHIARDGKH